MVEFLATFGNYAEAREFCDTRRARKLGPNTYLLDFGESIAIKYHRTEILTYRLGGDIELNTAGWTTPTTKERINAFLPARRWNQETLEFEGFGAAVWQALGAWYLTVNAEGAEAITYCYADRLILHADATVTLGGAPLSIADPEADAREYRRIQGARRRDKKRRERATRAADALARAEMAAAADTFPDRSEAVALARVEFDAAIKSVNRAARRARVAPEFDAETLAERARVDLERREAAEQADAERRWAEGLPALTRRASERILALGPPPPEAEAAILERSARRAEIERETIERRARRGAAIGSLADGLEFPARPEAARSADIAEAARRVVAADAAEGAWQAAEIAEQAKRKAEQAAERARDSATAAADAIHAAAAAPADARLASIAKHAALWRKLDADAEREARAAAEAAAEAFRQADATREAEQLERGGDMLVDYDDIPKLISAIDAERNK